MSVSEEKLIAFGDGELGGAELAEMETALASDAALQARVAQHRALRSKLSAAFDGALSEPVPAVGAGRALSASASAFTSSVC